MTAEIEESTKKEGEAMERRLQKTDVILPKETLEAFGGDGLRARVFYEKYALTGTSQGSRWDGPEAARRRVASELATVEVDEAKRIEWTEKFYWLQTISSSSRAAGFFVRRR